MITSTAIIAGMCVASICLASLVAHAADRLAAPGTPPAGASGTALPSVTDLVIDPFNRNAPAGANDLAAGGNATPGKDGFYRVDGINGESDSRSRDGGLTGGKASLNTLHSLGSTNDLFAATRDAHQESRSRHSNGINILLGDGSVRNSDKPLTATAGSGSSASTSNNLKQIGLGIHYYQQPPRVPAAGAPTGDARITQTPALVAIPPQTGVKPDLSVPRADFSAPTGAAAKTGDIAIKGAKINVR